MKHANAFRYYTNTVVLVFAVLLFAATSAWAGDATKGETFQPGAEGAASVNAADFSTLQEALDSLPPGGGVVNLPPGRFEISQPLTLTRGDAMLRGVGTATHIVNQNEAGEPGLLVQPPEGTKSLWRVQIADLRITGNPKSGPGILARKIDELLISRVASEHHGGDGILLDHCYEDPRVSDCLVNYNAATGLNLLGCHDIIVSANQFEENMDGIHCIDGYNLTMTGNNLDDHLGNGLVVENTYGSVVSGNMIEECNGHAVVLKGDCYGDALSANTFAHCQGEGVRLENVRDITISANAFVLLAVVSIHALDGAAQLTITGNTFSRYPFDPERSRKGDPGSGIVLETTRDVTIAGNTFTATRHEAIKTVGESSRRIAITGNTVLNASSEEAGAHSAFAIENASHCIVANNIVHDGQEKKEGTAPAIRLQGACEANQVRGNIVTGYEVGIDAPGPSSHIESNIAQ